MRSTIIQALKDEQQYVMQSHDIINEQTQCAVNGQVLYTANISTSDQKLTSSSQLVSLIYQWVSHNVSVNDGSTEISISRECLNETIHTNNTNCTITTITQSTTITHTTTATVTPTPSVERTEETAGMLISTRSEMGMAVIGGGILLLVILLMIISILACALTVALKKYKK